MNERTNLKRWSLENGGIREIWRDCVFAERKQASERASERAPEAEEKTTFDLEIHPQIGSSRSGFIDRRID